MVDESSVAASPAGGDEEGPTARGGSGGEGDVDADGPLDNGADATEEPPQRSVSVPMDLYKTVTVFSTFIAIVLVVGGMIALDTATGRSRLAPEDVNLPIALVGLGAIVLGAAVYAFSTRFRAEGMGNPKDGDDEP